MKPSALSSKRARPYLGTLVEITVWGAPQIATDESLNYIITQAFLKLEALEKILNAFDPQSEVSKLNQLKKIDFCDLSAELSFLIQAGADIERKTDRAFKLMPACNHTQTCYQIGASVTRESDCKFDLGGIAKGFIVDRIFEFLCSTTELENVLVNAGGDMRCLNSLGAELRIPTVRGEKRFNLNLSGAVATSSLLGSELEVGSAAARFPAVSSGKLKTVSVFAHDCMTADALTKVALCAKDPSAIHHYWPNVSVLGFDLDGERLL